MLKSGRNYSNGSFSNLFSQSDVHRHRPHWQEKHGMPILNRLHSPNILCVRETKAGSHIGIVDDKGLLFYGAFLSRCRVSPG